MILFLSFLFIRRKKIPLNKTHACQKKLFHLESDTQNAFSSHSQVLIEQSHPSARNDFLVPSCEK